MAVPPEPSSPAAPAPKRLVDRLLRLRSRLPRPKLLAALAAALVLFVVVSLSSNTSPPDTDLSLRELDELLAEKSIESAELIYETEQLTLTLTDGEERTAALPRSASSDYSERLEDAGAEVTVVRLPTPSALSQMVSLLLPTLILMAGIVFIVRYASSSLGGVKSNKNTTSAALIPSTRFADVAGCDEVVDQLREVVDFLRSPGRFAATKATLPHGMLLVGPPGTGKTLLAKATAGEARVPFFSMTGADFTEVFVGTGAARVRGLFRAARKHPAAVIFIDEIDSVGRARSSGPSNGGVEERESTLNMLLAEMDGVSSSGRVFVLAATNRADILDPALLRPGRFDRTITVDAPDVAGRERLLALAASRRGVDPSLDLSLFARRTPGMTGADIENMVNEAALIAAKAGRPSVGRDDLEAALANTVMGRARSRVRSEQEQDIAAWHEAGHALVGLLDQAADDPVTVSVVPRGSAGGVTWFNRSDEQFLTASKARATLRTLLAGREAEKILLAGDFTQGASDDMRAASQLAWQMVAVWGMSDLGFGHFDHSFPWAAASKQDVQQAVAALLTEAQTDTAAMLARHTGQLGELARLLREHETLHHDDLARFRAEQLTT